MASTIHGLEFLTPLDGKRRDDEPCEIGAMLSDKFLVLRKVGTGGTGVVYEARNLAVDRRVAIKVLHPRFADDAEVVRRFRSEARAVASIGHPNIVEFIDLGQTDDGLPYLVMEFLEGEDLYTYLSQHAPLDSVKATGILRRVLSAVGAAHEAGVVHRDLKPENIFLTTCGPESEVVKVLDFGAAKSPVREQDWFDTGERLIGTPAYMSPEQAAGEPLDHRTDLYAIGVLLFEMLSARLPYAGDGAEVLQSIVDGPTPRLRDVAPSVDAGLAQVVEKAMARDPDARYQSAAELLLALSPYLVEERHVPLVQRRQGPPPVTEGAVAPRSEPPGNVSLADTVRAPSPPERRRPLTSETPAALPLRWHPTRWLVALALLGAASYAGWRGPGRPYVDRAIGMVGLAPARIQGVHLNADLTPSFAPSFSFAPVASVTLDVDSNVDASSVFVDGRLVGHTPLRWTTRPDRVPHVVRVEAEGFASVEQVVELRSAQRVMVELQELEEIANGSSTLDSPPPAPRASRRVPARRLRARPPEPLPFPRLEIPPPPTFVAPSRPVVAPAPPIAAPTPPVAAPTPPVAAPAPPIAAPAPPIAAPAPPIAAPAPPIETPAPPPEAPAPPPEAAPPIISPGPIPSSPYWDDAPPIIPPAS